MANSEFTAFGDFYAEVRNYFGTNVQEFEHFKRQSSGRKKIEFLLAHPEVTKALERLQAHGDTPRPDGFQKRPTTSEDLTPQRTPLESFKWTPKYPQLSAKVGLQTSKKKGRHLVAKEKILPGTLFFP